MSKQKMFYYPSIDRVPMYPYVAYQGRGWKGTPIFFDKGRSDFRGRHRSFKEARIFVRKLGLGNVKEWKVYCKSGEKPEDIPFTPARTYKGKGWITWGDFLGTGYVSHTHDKHRPFQKAQSFARRLHLKNCAQWRVYVKSGKKPHDIPSAPDLAYKNDGWVSWGDWLGTESIHQSKKTFRSFEQAKDFAIGLGFKSKTEWEVYCLSGGKPADIPSDPRGMYQDSGWNGWSDFLGNSKSKIQRCPNPRFFLEARQFVRKLGFKSTEEWTKYCKSETRPDDIPTNPRYTYKNFGWISMGDWLGTGYVANKTRKYRSFKDSHAFVLKLGLKGYDEWIAYCKSGKKPHDIPSSPARVYRDNGWYTWGYFLRGDNKKKRKCPA